MSQYLTSLLTPGDRGRPVWSYCKKNYDAKKAKEIPEFDAKKLKKKSAPSVAVKKLK